ncbi:uncharacterized protein [Antedon mediterranea]|uniref:uncharacterized protein n=1 Tax=Antedon mediterranea TaxID=105859 RepID=UPI003AF8B9E0
MKPEFSKAIIERWKSIDTLTRCKHNHAIKICFFAPFLFGKSYVPECWLRWLQEAGFLKNAKKLEVTCHKDSFFFALDTLDKIFNALVKKMEIPIFFYSCMTVVEDIDSYAQKSEDCTKIGKAESTFCDFLNDHGATFERKMAVLYCAKAYVEYVVYVLELGKSRISDMKNSPETEKKIEKYRQKGNDKFKEGLIERATALYSKAIDLDPYNHYLYGNRAQTYLKKNMFREALWDSRRALILKPTWAKAYYRYAQALYELNFLERAKRENIVGLQFVDDGNEKRDLTLQKIKFDEHSEKPLVNDDDVPDLVEQCGSSGSSDEDNSESSPMPELVSDGLESFSDDASDSEFFEPTIARLTAIRKKRAIREKKEKEERLRKEENKKKSRTNSTPASSKSKKPCQDIKIEVKLQRRTKPAAVSIQSPIRKSEKSEMDQEFEHGYKSYTAKKYRNALSHYQKAVKILHDAPEKFGGMGEVRYVEITYCHAHICLSTDIPDEIMKSQQLFRKILKEHEHILFPLVYYGFGCFYQRINRFSVAVEYLIKGENHVKLGEGESHPIFWPGTTELVRESLPGIKLKSFEDLIHECKNPPKPLAVCSFDQCIFIKQEIYLTDIDFKGYVHTICTEDCRLDYHILCWKHFKVENYNYSHEKDILHKNCTTPDCLGTVCTISTYGSDGLVRSEAKAEPSSKAKHPPKVSQPQQPTTSKSKKKRLKKKQKKISEDEPEVKITEATSETKELQTKSKDMKPKKETTTTPEIDAATVTEEKPKEEATKKKEEEIPKEQVNYEYVLKKDDIEEVFPTHSKATKKKKQKSKKAISDFQIKFTGDEDRRFWGHEDADENGFIEYTKYMTPLPNTSDESPISIPGVSPQALETFTETMDEMIFMMYSYFHAVLEKEGPLPINSSKLLDDFNSFPEQAHVIVDGAGGLHQFLLKSLKFAMFEDHICLLKHAVRCKEILARKHGQPIDPDMEAARIHKSPEPPPNKFQPLLSLEMESLKKKVVNKSYNTVDGVDEITIDELDDDDDDDDDEKLSEQSDRYSTASETDHNGAVDQDDEESQSTETSTEENSLKNSDGSQESKAEDCSSKKIIEKFPGDEEYIDDDILGQELELERYIMEESSIGSSQDDDAKEQKSSSLNVSDSNGPTPVPTSSVNDSGIGSASPGGLTMGSVDASGKLTNNSNSVLPPEIVKGFCLNTPTPFSYEKEKNNKSDNPCVSDKKEPLPAKEEHSSQEKTLDQNVPEEKDPVNEDILIEATALFNSFNENFDWFKIDLPNFDNSEKMNVVKIPHGLWWKMIECLIKFKNRCMDIEKKKFQRKSKFVQCTPKTKNVCLITTPYEPFKQELLESMTKNNQLQESLKDSLTKYTHLKQSSVSESSRLKEENKKIQLLNEELSKNLKEKADLIDQHQKKLLSEQAFYEREGKAKADKLKNLDDDLIKMTTEMSKLSHKMTILHQERDKYFAEQNQMKEAIEENNRSTKGLKTRAEQSEINYLKIMCNSQCKILVDVIKEAERNRDKLKSSDESDNQSAIQTWQATVTVNAKKVRQLKNNYDVLIEKILSGTSLEHLPPVGDVSPYWPPPNQVKPVTKPVSTAASHTSAPQMHTTASSTSMPTNPTDPRLSGRERRETAKMPSNFHHQANMNFAHNQQWQQQQQYMSQNNMPPGSFNQQTRQMGLHGVTNGSSRSGGASSAMANFVAQVGPQVGSHVPPQVGSYVAPQVGSHVPPQVGSHVQPQVGSHVAPQVTLKDVPPLPSKVDTELAPHIASQLPTQGVPKLPPQSVSQLPQVVPQVPSNIVPQVSVAGSNESASVSNPTQPISASASIPISVHEKSEASSLKQTKSLGAFGGTVSGRVIPAPPPHLKNSFEKLIYQLGVMLDNQYTKGQLAMFLKEVRAANGNSLSGMPSKEIIERVVKMVLKREEHSLNQPSKISYSKKMPPPGISMSTDTGLSTWKTMPIRNPKPLSLEEDDPCVICHEEMPTKPVSTLECQHTFHTDCIQRWMNEQKTCPTCREFVLLPDDYPTL